MLPLSAYRQGQNDFAIVLAKIRDTAIFNRLYIKLYIKFVANNGKNRDFLLSLLTGDENTINSNDEQIF